MIMVAHAYHATCIAGHCYICVLLLPLEEAMTSVFCSVACLLTRNASSEERRPHLKRLGAERRPGPPPSIAAERRPGPPPKPSGRQKSLRLS